jgi:hypothetical protein
MIVHQLPSFGFPSFSETGTQYTVFVMLSLVPLVVLPEMVDRIVAAAVSPGSATDELVGRGVMGGSILGVCLLLTGAFGLR